MKRAAEIAALSRDHHQALAVAQKLRRATDETAATARAAFLDYWREHGEHHFRLEEDILLPAFARYGDARDPLVVDVLVDHVEIRRDAASVARDERLPAAELRRLGERLAAHVRHEERRLFPLVERLLPPDELARVAQALDR